MGGKRNEIEGKENKRKESGVEKEKKREKRGD